MTAKLFLFAAFVVAMLLMSMNHKKRRKKIVFFGDSLTQQAVLFAGYIRQLKNMLQEEGVDDEYDLVASGVAGDKIYDLYLRLDEDILAKGADIVVIFIGINDVGHRFSTLTGTDIDRFEAFYIAIIQKLLAAGIKVVVCTPTVIGENPSFASSEDGEIERYSEAIKRLAATFELAVVDLRKAFTEYIVVNNPENRSEGVLTTDKVHLNYKGNELVAEEMWKVLKDIK